MLVLAIYSTPTRTPLRFTPYQLKSASLSVIRRADLASPCCAV